MKRKGKKMKSEYKKLKEKGIVNDKVKLGDLDPLLKQVGGNHYMYFAIQPAEFINENKLLFAEGNAIKYICRHSEKGGIQDIDKAIHYLEMVKERDYT
jgi:hypothetical protein